MIKKSKNSLRIKWPKISMIFVAYNDAKGIRRCLESVRRQSYPQDLIDIVFVDDGSTDDSVEVARSFGARIFVNPKNYIYKNWILGMHNIKGEFIFSLETDIVLAGEDFIKKMVAPMLEDKRIIASFTDEKASADMHWSARFLTYNHAMCDPLLEFLLDKLENKIIERKKDYSLCKFDEKLQQTVRMFYRVEYLKNTLNWKAENYFDHDFLINCIRSGYPYFAYVSNPGYVHYTVKSLRQLIYKRVRNVKMHFLPYYKKTEYVFLNTGKKNEVLKLILFVIYANLLFPAAIRGLFRFLKHKDWVLLLEPIIAVGVIDALIITFLKDKKGRMYISDSLKSLFS
ncbi:MAG: glycosyltransferase family 2 protein [Candidatus Levybacteria bacterium]|nr:glycosyltransferase family 2 protein [Candidatus Levybacteria bacterium]